MNELLRKVDHLMKNLSPQERVRGVLHSINKRQDIPSGLWRSIPTKQQADFNDLISLVSKTNSTLFILALILSERIFQLRESLYYLKWIEQWQKENLLIVQLFNLSIRQPITESDYQKQLEAAREEWWPLAEVAEFFVGEQVKSAEGANDGELHDCSETDWQDALLSKKSELEAHLACGDITFREWNGQIELQTGSLSTG